MSSTPYKKGVQALQDLLPPLEDCPNCGSELVRAGSKPAEVPSARFIALAVTAGIALHLLDGFGKARRRF